MRQVLRYGLVAYGITWLAVLPLVLQGLGIVSWNVPPAWHGLGALGPVLAAWWMRRSTEPAMRWTDVYRRQGRRVADPVIMTALALSPIMLLVLTLAGVSIGGGSLSAISTAVAPMDPTWITGLFVASVLYGFGEEPGWRGWLLPHLQAKRGAVRATLIVAVIWAVWHAPFFAYRFDFDGLPTVIGFFVGLLAGAFWLTFVFNSTGGSVLTVAVWHMLWNAANLIAAPSAAAVMVLNGLMIVLGYGVAIVWGRHGLRLNGFAAADGGRHEAGDAGRAA